MLRSDTVRPQWDPQCDQGRNTVQEGSVPNQNGRRRGSRGSLGKAWAAPKRSGAAPRRSGAAPGRSGRSKKERSRSREEQPFRETVEPF